MEKILRGYQKFRRDVYAPNRAKYEEMAHKQQKPHALLIACSDSRIDPNLITGTEPGELFILRNAGNIVPPYGSANGGEGATVEYAVAVLGIKNIIVCGHQNCGAMQALLRRDTVRDLPAVSAWFSHAEATRRVVEERYAGQLAGDELLRAATEENVLIQLNHLGTHPFVAARLARGEVSLYGWYYRIETGEIFQYDQQSGEFRPLEECSRPAVPLAIRSAKPSDSGRLAAIDGATRVNGNLVEVAG